MKVVQLDLPLPPSANVIWRVNRRTGKPIHNAIVWQDTRTQPLIDALAEDGGPGRFALRRK